MKKIKALSKNEFTQALSNGYVYGKYKNIYVYIELGMKDQYISHPKDDPKTEYRFFRNCTIEYSEKEEQLEQGIYQYKEEGVDVVVYW